MSTYSIHEVTTRDELDGVIDVAWEAWWDPYLPVQRIAYPVFGHTAADRARSIAQSKDRMWAEYEKLRETGKKRWIYARHSGGDIVGGVQLDFAAGSPFPNGCPQLNLYWWPEGEEVRDFCEEMMRQAYTPGSIWMQRPHGGMSNFVVLPKHRGKGVGTLLMDYNVRELDSRGIEAFVESSELGRPSYEKAGYQVVMKVASWIPAGKSDDWKRWYHEMGVQPMYAMWRPKYGKIEPGERTKPWQQAPSLPT